MPASCGALHASAISAAHRAGLQVWCVRARGVRGLEECDKERRHASGMPDVEGVWLDFGAPK